jgi:hypothetical protein
MPFFFRLSARFLHTLSLRLPPMLLTPRALSPPFSAFAAAAAAMLFFAADVSPLRRCFAAAFR